MYKSVWPFIFFLLINCSIEAGDYTKPTHIDAGRWEQLKPYFLPYDHPLRPQLDAIFSVRALSNDLSLAKAGFSKPQSRKWSGTVVTKHPKMKGFFFKLYTDEMKYDDAHELFARIIGAKLAQEAINRHGWQHYFVVPKKWIYPLPENPPPVANCKRKNFILIAEDVHILSKGDNYYWWKTKLIRPELLDALYTIVQEEGLDDSILPCNVPITKDLKLAFVDTAVYHRWPIRFNMLKQFLTPKMQDHWDKLIQQNGPQ